MLSSNTLLMGRLESIIQISKLFVVISHFMLIRKEISFLSLMELCICHSDIEHGLMKSMILCVDVKRLSISV